LFLINAIKNDYLEVVELLLKDDRVDPTTDDNYTIRLASRNGHVEVVELLLETPKIPLSVKNIYFDVKVSSKLFKLTLDELEKKVGSDKSINKLLRTKFFWWTRLELYNKVPSKEIMQMDPNTDPIKLSLAYELYGIIYHISFWVY